MANNATQTRRSRKVVPSHKRLPRDPNPIIGYQEAWRWFSVRGDSQRNIALVSLSADYEWLWDSENYANLKAHAGDFTPGPGFYAYKSDHVEDPEATAGWFSFGMEFCFARVALYGTVIEHEYGFRAEKARILDVWCKNEKRYDTVCHHPQVKGIFKFTYPTLLDYMGRQRTDVEWLTLENRKECAVSSQSSFLIHYPELAQMTYNQASPTMIKTENVGELWTPPSPYTSRKKFDKALEGVPSDIASKLFNLNFVERLDNVCPRCNLIIENDALVVNGGDGLVHYECAESYALDDRKSWW